MLETDFVFWVFYDDPLPLCPSKMFNFKQLENLERILLLKAGVVPVDVHLHLDLHHEVHNKVQHCSVFSCTFNVQNIWFGRGSQSSRPIRDQITFHQWGERITIRCPDPLSELQISRGYSCSPCQTSCSLLQCFGFNFSLPKLFLVRGSGDQCGHLTWLLMETSISYSLGLDGSK